VGDRKVSNINDVLDAAFYLTAGQEVPLTVSRGGQAMEIKVLPGPSPLAGGAASPAPTFSLSLRLGK